MAHFTFTFLVLLAINECAFLPSSKILSKNDFAINYVLFWDKVYHLPKRHAIPWVEVFCVASDGMK